MRSVALIVVVLFAGMLGLNSCGADKAPTPNPIDTGGLLDSSKITYSLKVSTIFNTNCNVSGCHDVTTHQNALILDTYDRCKAAVETRNVICRVEGTACGPRMPFGRPPLPDSTINEIKIWKARNYPL